MNSPFGKKMFEKNPISALQQNAFNAARIAAIEKGADTFKVGDKTFQVKGDKSGINMGSPYHKHGKLEKKLKKAEAGKIGAEQGDKDYELIADLKAQIKQEKAKHSSKRTEEDDMQAREDEDAARGAAMEMAPLKKNASPLDRGGYVGGGDVAGGDYVSTAGAYQQMFNKIEGATKQFIAGQENPDYEGKAERQANRVARREKRGVKKGFGKFDEKTGEYVANDNEKSSKFNEKTNLIDAKSITNREMSKKEKESAYDGLVHLMTDEDKKKYGIT